MKKTHETNMCVGRPVPDADWYLPQCGAKLSEYFWRDGIHPSSAIHGVVAAQISKLLQAGPNICGSTASA